MKTNWNTGQLTLVQICCELDPPVMSVAEFFGIVSPGSKPFWVQGINLHEKLSGREKTLTVNQD